MSLRIAILGLGLIGGSLGLALKQKGPENLHITGFDINESSCEEALRLGAIDRSCQSYEFLSECEIIFLCAPVLQIRKIAAEIRPFVKAGTIVTDVGSTKQYLQNELEPLFSEGVQFIGGHPMAGREMSGMLAAQSDLFENKWYILIRSDQQSEESLQKLAALIEYTGASVTYMNAADHDRYAAVISHLPHIASAGLVNMLNHYDDADSIIKLAGGGFRDTTRIASSNAHMWSDICLTNQEALIDCIKKYQLLLNELIQNIEQGNRDSIYDYFYQAKLRRDSMIDKVNN